MPQNHPSLLQSTLRGSNASLQERVCGRWAMEGQRDINPSQQSQQNRAIARPIGSWPSINAHQPKYAPQWTRAPRRRSSSGRSAGTRSWCASRTLNQKEAGLFNTLSSSFRRIEVARPPMSHTTATPHTHNWLSIHCECMMGGQSSV